ncbi:hypothetical protein F2Q69_00014271 [Brassica cretica]|uniref:Uncharacterized protein n=1 Tax=Brassica cretica TaxID=69181 RepID=A0A8S9QTR2_BRACR|nr:hypothetical protein F2Q69_00014271 [Brassica cretica]
MEDEVFIHTSQIDGHWITQLVAPKLECYNSIDLICPLIQENEIGRFVKVIFSANCVKPGETNSYTTKFQDTGCCYLGENLVKHGRRERSQVEVRRRVSFSQSQNTQDLPFLFLVTGSRPHWIYILADEDGTKMEMTISEGYEDRFRGLEKQEGKLVEIFRVEVHRAYPGFQTTNSRFTLNATRHTQVYIIDRLKNQL